MGTNFTWVKDHTLTLPFCIKQFFINWLLLNKY